MIRSQPILPIRFYDDLFDQDRFNKFHHGELYSQIHYPVNALPNFQIFRKRSLQAPTRFMLRNICSDGDSNFYKVVPDGVFVDYDKFTAFFGSNFTIGTIYDDGVNTPEGRIVPMGKIVCNKVEPKPLDPFYTPSPGTVGWLEIPILSLARYNFKLQLDKLIQSMGSTFNIKIYDGDDTGLLLATITSQGTYTLNFKAINNKLTIYFEDYVPDSDKFEISDIQAMIYPSDFAGYATDVVLDPNAFVFTNFDTQDGGILVYCTASQNNDIQPGEYYYIVECGMESYYSEVFSVKSLKEIENFYKLTWWNNCDLNGVIYNAETLSDCTFKNTLYLDAALFKPEYDTTTENTQDGENTEVPVFKKWQKALNLEIIKSNEFLADALSGIFLHDNAFIQVPLNKKQIIQNGEYPILQITSDVQAVLEDAFQKVVMRFLLSKFFVKANCCNDVEMFACDRCTYSASDDPENADYYLVLTPSPDPGDGLFSHDGDVLIAVKETDIICDLDSGKFYRLGLIGGNQYYPILEAPKINSAVAYPGYYLVSCSVLPNTFAQLQYNIDGGGWIDGENRLAPDSGFVDVPFNSGIMVGATDVKLRVVIKAPGCSDYGTSDVYDLL